MKTLKEMRILLANGTAQDFVQALPDFDILTTDSFGNTLLHLYLHKIMERHHASALDDWEFYVSCLLNAGIPIDAKNKRLGATHLNMSLACHNKELCEYLIQHGADVNAVDRYGKSILVCAILSRNGTEWDETIIPLLIENGADIDAPVPFHGTVRNFVANLSDIGNEFLKKLFL